MAQRGRPKKELWEDLPQEWKDLVNSMKREDLEREISNVAYNQVELMKLKAEDADLARAKEEARIAGEQYREGTKMNKLKIAYAKECLDGQGGPTKSSD